MVIHKRIQQLRKQSRIVSPVGNLWFLSEESAMHQAQQTKKQAEKNDRLRSFDDHFKYRTSETLKKQLNRNDCLFVVDWQMSDTF
jgi:hypothetical protein